MIKPFLKLPAKIALLTLIFTMSGVILVGYVTFTSVEKLLREQSFSDISNELRRKSNQYMHHVHALRNTLFMLSDSSSIIHLAELSLQREAGSSAQKEAAIHTVANDLLAIMEHQSTYLEMAIIGNLPEGRELLRVERNSKGRAVRVAEESLRLQSAEPNLLKAMRLNPNQFTLSEHFALPAPVPVGSAASGEPILQMAVPLFANEEDRAGVLIVRENFRQVARTLFRQSSDEVQFLIADREGALLHFPDKARQMLQELAKQKGHTLNNNSRLQNLFANVPQLWSDGGQTPRMRHQMSIFVDSPTQIALTEQGIHLVLQRIYFDPETPNRHFIMIAFAPNTTMVQGIQQYWQDILKISLGISLLLCVLIVLATRQLTWPIRRLTQSIQRIAAGEENVQIEVTGTDEVGDLALAFRSLLETLNVSHRALRNLAASLEEQVRERTNDLAVARDQALAASQAKSLFLATMSHEIRTPMNVILGMLELLRTSDIRLPDRERVELALGAGQTLLTLINNVLDFSKMDGKQLVLDRVDFDLRRLVYEAAMTVAPLAHTKGIELTAFFPDVTYTAVRGDPIRLKQVFINLLGNAIKFTPEGGTVELYGGPVGSDAAGIDVLFEVRDSGIGVTEEDRAKIFSRFTQVDSSSTRRHEGTGLGLSICKHLVEMMEGEIHVDSNPDTPSGSVFYFTIRLEKQQRTYNRHDKTQDLKGMRILAVAQDGLLRTLVEDALISQGARLDHVVEVEHAPLILQEADALGEPYQLVLCNQKPGLSHRREFQQLLNCNAELRFILLTDLLDQGWDQATELPGTAICLKKPINAERLLAAIEWLIRNQGSHAAQESERSHKEPLAWRAEGRILIVDDQQANLIVTRGMLINVGYRSDQIVTALSGQEAITQFRQQRFDLVLMDCQMPVMDGFEATRAIHALEQGLERPGGRVPIVAFTADVTPQARTNIQACGMDGFLAKPVSIADLRNHLRQFSLLRPEESVVQEKSAATAGQSKTELPPEESAPQQVSEQVERVDMEALLRSMRSIGLQEEDFREVAELLAAQFLELLNTMQRDLEQESYQSARATAHVVKGSMANTIFPTLQKPTRTLYEAVKEQRWQEALQELAYVRRLYQPIQEALLLFLSGGA
ncbi:ATP-binding protein [Candidatus Magnetaquicoccus inordinatus]|uniref:ATP-binding protein n=1 Tax=Candidatus Magnetaquicoccus inordinatus TaxID=2496818 RepID=UPI00102C2043|nr:ATP-binding protein [Candidatus Magnetaquicoccus inordinatus]